MKNSGDKNSIFIILLVLKKDFLKSIKRCDLSSFSRRVSVGFVCYISFTVKNFWNTIWLTTNHLRIFKGKKQNNNLTHYLQTYRNDWLATITTKRRHRKTIIKLVFPAASLPSALCHCCFSLNDASYGKCFVKYRESENTDEKICYLKFMLVNFRSSICFRTEGASTRRWINTTRWADSRKYEELTPPFPLCPEIWCTFQLPIVY